MAYCDNEENAQDQYHIPAQSEPAYRAIACEGSKMYDDNVRRVESIAPRDESLGNFHPHSCGFFFKRFAQLKSPRLTSYQ